MGYKNKLSLVAQIKQALDSRLAIGQSKHLAKLNGTSHEHIYSWETYRSYMKHCNYFTAWCKNQQYITDALGHKARTLEECRPYVDDWLKTRLHLSAYTQKLEASALAKLYGCSTKDFVKTATRNRSQITRSRGEKIRDVNFSEENHRDLVSFCRSTGLRRAELNALTGDKLIFKNDKPYIVVSSGSKGGRYREAPVIGEVELVIRLMRSAGNGKVFDKIPNGADIHSYRSDYATAIYRNHARPIQDIPYDAVNRGTGRFYQSGVYNCRGDQKGVKLDKLAMLEATHALGHNRISVVAEHYIR